MISSNDFLLFLDYCKAKDINLKDYGKTFCEFFSIMDGDLINETDHTLAYAKIQIEYLGK